MSLALPTNCDESVLDVPGELRLDDVLDVLPGELLVLLKDGPQVGEGPLTQDHVEPGGNREILLNTGIILWFYFYCFSAIYFKYYTRSFLSDSLISITFFFILS